LTPHAATRILWFETFYDALLDGIEAVLDWPDRPTTTSKRRRAGTELERTDLRSTPSSKTKVADPFGRSGRLAFKENA
jgi:hypothetical protein